MSNRNELPETTISALTELVKAMNTFVTNRKEGIQTLNEKLENVKKLIADPEPLAAASPAVAAVPAAAALTAASLTAESPPADAEGEQDQQGAKGAMGGSRKTKKTKRGGADVNLAQQFAQIYNTNDIVKTLPPYNLVNDPSINGLKDIPDPSHANMPNASSMMQNMPASIITALNRQVGGKVKSKKTEEKVKKESKKKTGEKVKKESKKKTESRKTRKRT
jgi:hypothetical protein